MAHFFIQRCLYAFVLGTLSSTMRLVAADSADAISPTSVVFTWDDARNDETGYRVERAPAPSGPFATVQTLPANTDVWTDTSLTPATTYYYRSVPMLEGGDGPTGETASVTTLVAGDSTARMRQNALNYWRAIGASRKSARMVAAIASIDTDAQLAFSTMNSDGSWSDITYTDLAPASNWTPRFHYERLQDMARAWATPGAALHKNAGLLAGILKGIDFIETKINTTINLAGGNWWWWQIGAPERYGPALVLVRDELGSTRLNAAVSTLNHLVGTSPREGGNGIQNWVWVGMNRLYHGMLANNSSSIQGGATMLADQVAFAVPGGEGIMPDFSFQAHGTTISSQWLSQLATGQYGASYLAYIPRFTFFAEGTTYQISAEKQEILANYATEGARWAVWGEYKDISSEGRSYTRVGNNAGEIMSGLLALANTPGSPAQSAAAATTKALLTGWTRSLLPEDAGFAAIVEASATTAALPEGVRLYADSDYAISRWGGAMISLKTISNRSLIGELVNNENKRGRHLASGVTWITTGSEYRTNDVIPTLDHARLSGTTVENGVSLTASTTWNKVPGLRSFVGGATSGNIGTTAMDFQSRANSGDSNLVAKKSWFFFADSMVALGTGITSTVNRTVETTVNQRPLPTLAADISVNGTLMGTAATNGTTFSNTSWVHAANVGYVFPTPSTVKIKRQNQTGKWSDIGAGDTTARTTPMFTLWFDHGNHVTTPASANATYAYAVLPGKSAAQTQAVAAAAPYQILAQTSALHAVKHATENAGGAVFWQAGTVDKITVNTPCVVSWRQTGTTLSLALSEPTHATATVELTYAGRLMATSLPAGVTATAAGANTTLTFSVADGKNYAATFQFASPAAPTGLSAAALSGSAVRLTWTDNSDDETGFRIERSMGGGSFSLIHTTAAGVTTFDDTGLAPGTTCLYRVLATNANGNSAPTAAQSATTWSALQSWRNTHFGTTIASGNAADDADPDADGLPNLVEYALGGEPKIASPPLVPVVDMAPGELTLTFTRPTLLAGILYAVETSPSLAAGSWTTEGVTMEVVEDHGATEVVVATLALTLTGTRQFLRLRVTQAPPSP